MGNYHFISIEERTEGILPNLGTKIEKLSFVINISPMQYLSKAQKDGRQIVLLYQLPISKTEFDLFN